MGEEVRAGRGWMFWRLTLSLTQAGEDALEHVVATVYRAIQVGRLHLVLLLVFSCPHKRQVPVKPYCLAGH